MNLMKCVEIRIECDRVMFCIYIWGRRHICGRKCGSISLKIGIPYFKEEIRALIINILWLKLY